MSAEALSDESRAEGTMGGTGDTEGLQVTVYNVEDILPRTTFRVAVRDIDQNPLPGVLFQYAVDDGEKRDGKTDDSGQLALNGPEVKSAVSLFLV